MINHENHGDNEEAFRNACELVENRLRDLYSDAGGCYVSLVIGEVFTGGPFPIEGYASLSREVTDENGDEADEELSAETLYELIKKVEEQDAGA